MKSNSKVKISLLIFIFSLLLISCKKNNSNDSLITENEIKTYNINGSKILEDKFDIYQVYSLDSLLLIKNIPSSENLAFSVYSSKNGEFNHLLDFGTIGEGPNEFENQVYYTNQFVTKDNDLKVWIYENNRNNYSLLNLSKIIKTKKTVIDTTIKIKPGSSYLDLFHINDNKIVGNMDNLAINMARLNFYNPIEDTFTKKVKLVPELINPQKNDINYTQQSYNAIFVNLLRYSSSKEKLVSPMIAMDRIDIFDTNGNLEHSINNIIEPINNVADYIQTSKGGKSYTVDVKLTDNFIYTLYSGDYTSSYFGDSTPTKIKVYDWNYNLKYIINTNDSSNFISVNEKEGFIIGTSITEEKVVLYNIKEILQNEL